MAAAQLQTGRLSGPSGEDAGVELILLDVLYNHLRLETALSALQDVHGKRYLPLRQLSNTLGFRLHVDPLKRVAGGFLIDPSDRIAFNGVTGRCIRKRQSILFDPSRCFEREGELYVEADVLGRVAGLHFEWLLNKLELDVTSDATLPVAQQWIRRQILDRDRPADIQMQLPLVRTPYSLWSLPSLDMQWYTDAKLDDKASEATSRLQIQGRGDLFFMSARYRFVSGIGDKPAATMLSLGRDDPHASLLGPLHATQFSFGDLTLPQIPLFARTRNGLGATFSNFPLPGMRSGAPAQLDGHAPARSTVELYRGSELLANVRADAQGRYEFTSVPLESGPNDLRVIVITPEGDVQEESRTLYGDGAGPAPGRGQYRFTVADIGGSMFPHGITGISDEQRRIETIGEYQFGLRDGSWLGATASECLGTEYIGLGYHSWAGGSLWHVQGMASDDGGSAFAAGISRKFGNATVSLEHTLASGHFGGRILPEIGDNIRGLTRLRLDGTSGDRHHPIGYGLSIDRVDGATPATLLRARLNGGDGHTFFSNTIASRISGDPLDMTGYLQVRRQLGGTLVRFDLGYGFGSERLFQDARFSLDRRISGDYRVRYGLEYDATRLGRLETVGALYRVLGPFEVGLGLTVDSRGALKANVLLSVGMEGADALHSIALARPGTVATGSVGVRVYLDRNFNGRFDAGDTVLPNIGLKVGGRPAIVKTGSDGTCFVDRLASNQEVTVAVNEDSFEDPCWASWSEGALVIPRSGRVAHVDLGVIEAAEIEGHIEGSGSAEGLTAQLIDNLGKVVHTSVLYTDGSYVFSHVKPGDYTLRLIDPEGKPCGQRPLRVPSGVAMKDCNVKPTVPKN
jgi:hypothetical protein